MKLFVVVCTVLLVVSRGCDGTRVRAGRRLFGGYRITPRSCRPSRPAAAAATPPPPPTPGPTVCMFNGECARLGGRVAGACMDGFLFGACCALPDGVDVGDLADAGPPPDNTLGYSTVSGKPPTTPMDITMQGVSQITASLINEGMLPTAQDNEMVQVSGLQNVFSTTGVTHPQSIETFVSHNDNEIKPSHFNPTTQPTMEDRKTTVKIEGSSESYPDTPIIHISVSNAPIGYTPIPTIQRPIFRPKPPKPTDEKYVLVPTISHEPEPNRTQEHDSIMNILEMLNQTSTNKPFIKGSSRYPTTTKKPPSTSYVFSTTVPPRRTTQTTTTKKKPTKNKTKTTNKPPSTSYVYSSTFTPTKATFASSPQAFVASSTPLTVFSSTRRPPETSQPSVVQSTVAGPSFSVTSRPPGQYSPYPSPAPTLIVLGPVEDNEIGTEPLLPQSSGLPPSSSYRPPSTYGLPSTYRPPATSALPTRRPVNHVTVNNHVTQNIYSTQRPYLSERPSPTVLITPKPTISSSLPPQGADVSDIVEVTSSDELSNFPPVRNPNLNMSVPVINDDDVTTPAFIEDAALHDRVESFVNQIIIGLQEPFEGLKDIVYNKNKTTSTTPSANSATTKKPVNKQGTTTRRPATRPTSSSVASTVRTTRTTRRTTTRRATSAVPTRRQTTTARRTTRVTTRGTTKRPASTTLNLIEHEENVVDTGTQESYRNQCGVRPLVKSGRIVGGKGATFGEFPWQVLVRESTWLGLFTKNKCGGVLISDRYVMTAAHCQPGFLASLVAVFGEFDISGELESRKPVTRNVKRVIVHRNYKADTFENDLALLELETPVTFDAHIVPICLPRGDEDFTGRFATVTGWGRLRYGGGVPSVLQAVQVPVIEKHVCQEMFRTAGHAKVILDSFLCAGYANGQKDSCEGDSGGPLVLQRPDGRYQLAGTVSHGIKCAAPYLPGVYMRTTFFKPWITSITGIQ